MKRAAGSFLTCNSPGARLDDGGARVRTTESPDLYLGGSQGDDIRAIAVDSAGNAYVTGATASPDFLGAPSPLPGSIFVTKISREGELIYATFRGREREPASHGEVTVCVPYDQGRRRTCGDGRLTHLALRT